VNGTVRLALKKLGFSQFHEHNYMPDYMKLHGKNLLITQKMHKILWNQDINKCACYFVNQTKKISPHINPKI